MPHLITYYSSDEVLLTEISAAIGNEVDAIENPSEVESPAVLNLDPATVAQNIWQLLVVFGSVKGSLEAFDMIVNLLRERKTKGKTAKIQFTVPSGETITLEGNMTPEEVAREVALYKAEFTDAD